MFKNLAINTHFFIDKECSPISSDIFESIPNKKLDSFNSASSNQSFYARNLIKCISICLVNENCFLISYNSARCKLYNTIPYQYMIDSPTTDLYKRKSNAFDRLNFGLQNYWPIINSNVKDKVGTADMYAGVNVSFAYDRFNNTNSAIYLKNGFYSLPTGVYFCGDFTFSIWAYFRPQSTNWNKFIDFGNGPDADNIAMGYSYFGQCRVNVYIYKGGSPSGPTMSPSLITFNTWDHYAFTLSSNFGRLYINGNLVANSTHHKPYCVNRTSNHIGKSNFPNNMNANAIFDEIRLYNRALDPAEIQDLMKL